MITYLFLWSYLPPVVRQRHQAQSYRKIVLVTLYLLRYKSEGRGFDSRWYHWNFSLT